MAIAKDGNGTQIKVVYGAPWTGVDSSLPEDTIADSSTPFSDNVYIWRGELRSFPRFKNIPTKSLTYPILNSPDGTKIRNFFNGYFNQIIRTDVPPDTFTIDEPMQMLTGAITDSGVYILRPNWRNGQVLPGAPMYISNPHWQLGADISADNLYNPYANREFPAIISNTILYFSKGSSKIYSFDPSVWSNVTGGTLTVLADWFGCLFMQMINEHLVCVSTNEVTALSHGFFQSRVRWSPSGIFNEFDPTVNPAAGFNDLQDVRDIVTGFISLGTTGMIFRTNGITQMYPIGGLNPFGFNNLWASEHGIGSVFINTLDNFGNMCCFISEEDIYVMTPSSFKGISGKAKQAIYNDLLNKICFESVVGTLIPGFQDGHTHFLYQIYIPDMVTGTVPVLWTYSFDQDLWFRKVLLKTLDGISPITTTYRITTKPKVLATGDSNFPDYAPSLVQSNINNGVIDENRKILIASETTVTSDSGSIVSQDIFTFDTNDYASDEPITYQFKTEIVEEDTSPTFHRIRVIYRDFGEVSLIFTITGLDDTNTPVTVSKTQLIGTVGADQKIKRGYVDITFTGKQPQLTITRDAGGGPFAILRVTLLGDVGDIRA
jgi:hypothetical protein